MRMRTSFGNVYWLRWAHIISYCHLHEVVVAEWLRRLTWNQMGSSRTGSNPVHDDVFYIIIMTNSDAWVNAAVSRDQEISSSFSILIPPNMLYRKFIFRQRTTESLTQRWWSLHSLWAHRILHYQRSTCMRGVAVRGRRSGWGVWLKILRTFLVQVRTQSTTTHFTTKSKVAKQKNIKVLLASSSNMSEHNKRWPHGAWI
jgi:hypothetical protein